MERLVVRQQYLTLAGEDRERPESIQKARDGVFPVFRAFREMTWRAVLRRSVACWGIFSGGRRSAEEGDPFLLSQFQGVRFDGLPHDDGAGRVAGHSFQDLGPPACPADVRGRYGDGHLGGHAGGGSVAGFSLEYPVCQGQVFGYAAIPGGGVHRF